MPARFFITSGTTADCTVAAQLIEGFQAEYLLADRGYDTDAIVLKAAGEGMILLSRKKLGKAGGDVVYAVPRCLSFARWFLS